MSNFFFIIHSKSVFQQLIGAKLSIKNKRKFTPLDLIFLHVQNPGQFLGTLFDKSISKKCGTQESKWLKKIQFNYNILSPKVINETDKVLS